MRHGRTILAILTVLAIGIGCQGHRDSTSPTKPRTSDQFSIQGRVLQPEIAEDAESRARGLQHRSPPRDGLVLLFPFKDRHSIWMPNCDEDLEAWVISDQGSILEILDLPAQSPQAEGEALWQYHARLPRHRAQHRSRILWEFQAGTAADWNISTGDTIDGDWASLLNANR